MTPTCGGARSGNCAMGSVGMQTRAGENDQQGADGGEYRAMNKKVNHRRTVAQFVSRVLSSRCFRACCVPVKPELMFRGTFSGHRSSCCFPAGLRVCHRLETGCRRRRLCLPVSRRRARHNHCRRFGRSGAASGGPHIRPSDQARRRKRNRGRRFATRPRPAPPAFPGCPRPPARG